MVYIVGALAWCTNQHHYCGEESHIWFGDRVGRQVYTIKSEIKNVIYKQTSLDQSFLMIYGDVARVLRTHGTGRLLEPGGTSGLGRNKADLKMPISSPC